VLFLDLGKAFLLFGRQFGAAHAEIADGVVDDALAGRRQRAEFGRRAQCFVFAEQRFVLRQFGPELSYLGLVVVVGGAQFGRVDNIVQMADDAPGAAQQLGGVFQRRDEAVPAYLVRWRFQLRDDGAAFGQQRVDGRRDVLWLDGVETRQAGKVEERVGCVWSCQFPYVRYKVSSPPKRGSMERKLSMDSRFRGNDGRLRRVRPLPPYSSAAW
jgi:hypothetical protein